MNKPIWQFCALCGAVRLCKRVRHPIINRRVWLCGTCRKVLARQAKGGAA